MIVMTVVAASAVVSIGLVMADRATGGGAKRSVTSGEVAHNPANHGAAKATARFGLRRGEGQKDGAGGQDSGGAGDEGTHWISPCWRDNGWRPERVRASILALPLATARYLSALKQAARPVAPTRMQHQSRQTLMLLTQKSCRLQVLVTVTLPL